MRDLAELAEQIRAVRAAQRLFMGRWRIEQVVVGPEVLDRLADDMAAAHAELDDADDLPPGGGFGYPPPPPGSMYTNGGADRAA
jgi:hypothetical protein